MTNQPFPGTLNQNLARLGKKRAAEKHFRFEALHPFFDGNGRAGRLFLNWQLLQAGFPLTTIQVEEQARYHGALDQGHAGQLLDLQTLVAGAVERSLDLAMGRK